MTIFDKYIRKAIFDALDGVEINGVTFNVFTSQVTGGTSNNYFLVTDQLNTQVKIKSGATTFNHDCQIQVVVIDQVNSGSKVLLDDATQALITALESLSLDSGKLSSTEIDIEQDLIDTYENRLVYRKIVRFAGLIT